MAGEIVHVEFPAADADRAQSFWNGLFGWDFQDWACPRWTTGWRRRARAWASRSSPSEDRSGYPNYYFATDDIDASSAKVRELGGDAEGKMPVPGHGWFAACHDSEGNAFHLWQQDSSAG